MTPAAKATAKVRDLKRVRENQQRSRDRKRAYIDELEARVRLLDAKLKQCEQDHVTTTNSMPGQQASRENEARKELLKVLGIDASAQAQFVRAFGRREGGLETNTEPGAMEAGTGLSHDSITTIYKPSYTEDGDQSQLTADGEEGQLYSSRKTCCPTSPAQTVLPRTAPRSQDRRPTANMPPASERSPADQTMMTESAASPQHAHDMQTVETSSNNKPGTFTPCLWNATVPGSSSCTESMTGCSIAFSMLLANNSRGYTFADLDARLQAAYRKDESVAEGCSVLNKVLFQLLSEIS